MTKVTAEHKRLAQRGRSGCSWKKWGPYLSERQWGTVREDYSPHGTAWEYFPFEQAHLRAYRWGEDGIGGISDNHQRLCFAPAFWNGRDPILKERLYGLTGNQGNHGEDVKELYYYLDSTPTHSYLKMLYKYPHQEFPYRQLVEENSRRGKKDPEYEIQDTGIFNENKYFDVFIEYAKSSPEDILLKITVFNRGQEAAPLHVLPNIWFRNTWDWGYSPDKPSLERMTGDSIFIQHKTLGVRTLYAENPTQLLFCENESNPTKCYFIQSEKDCFFK